MGWTIYQASHYKNEKIDRKAECDAYWLEGLNAGHFEVVKSALIGTTYYAAITTLKRRVGHDVNGDVYEDIPKSEQTTFAVVFLTQTNSKDYFNFSYKDMDETMLPYSYDCPFGILDVLSPTSNKSALEWRKLCRQKSEEKKTKLSTGKLRVGSIIEIETKLNGVMQFTKEIRHIVLEGTKDSTKIKRITTQWRNSVYKISPKNLNSYQIKVLHSATKEEEEQAKNEVLNRYK